MLQKCRSLQIILN